MYAGATVAGGAILGASYQVALSIAARVPLEGARPMGVAVGWAGGFMAYLGARSPSEMLENSVKYSLPAILTAAGARLGIEAAQWVWAQWIWAHSQKTRIRSDSVRSDDGEEGEADNRARSEADNRIDTGRGDLD